METMELRSAVPANDRSVYVHEVATRRKRDRAKWCVLVSWTRHCDRRSRAQFTTSVARGGKRGKICRNG